MGFIRVLCPGCAFWAKKYSASSPQTPPLSLLWWEGNSYSFVPRGGFKFPFAFYSASNAGVIALLCRLCFYPAPAGTLICFEAGDVDSARVRVAVPEMAARREIPDIKCHPNGLEY
jgi:hypothetical protein